MNYVKNNGLISVGSHFKAVPNVPSAYKRKTTKVVVQPAKCCQLKIIPCQSQDWVMDLVPLCRITSSCHILFSNEDFWMTLLSAAGSSWIRTITGFEFLIPQQEKFKCGPMRSSETYQQNSFLSSSPEPGWCCECCSRRTYYCWACLPMWLAHTWCNCPSPSCLGFWILLGCTRLRSHARSESGKEKPEVRQAYTTC